jgi:hypothetical protein
MNLLFFLEFVQILVQRVFHEIIDQKHQQVKHLVFMNGLLNLHQVQKILFGNYLEIFILPFVNNKSRHVLDIY